MEAWQERSALLLGQAGLEKLQKAHVAVFGVGGVGGACAEALVRAGIGELTLFDPDGVSINNINRQLIALHSVVGQPKVEVCAKRFLDINPQLNLHLQPVFYSAENADMYPLSAYDYVVDAIDTVSSKLLMIQLAHEQQVPIISSMGTGNKLDPSRLEIADIQKTSVCPLARVMRRELKKRGIQHLTVVYSQEEPLKAVADTEFGRHSPGSISFVPPVAGYLLASRVIRDLTEKA